MIAHAMNLVAQGSLSDDLNRQVASIERAIERLRTVGSTEAQIRSLEGQLAQIKGEAVGALIKEAEGGKAQKAAGEKAIKDERIIKAFKDGVSEKSAARAREALTKPGHWAHETFKQELFRVIEAGGKIPDKYKVALARDTARLLEVCPKAGGLVTAMVTRGQPKGSFVRRMASENKNDAVGAAYEIMGTSALCQKVSKPANTKHQAPELHIDPVNDKLVFGPKAFMNHRYSDKGKVSDRDRRSTEGDALFSPKGRGDVAIDFKHSAEARSVGISKHRDQLKAVAEQIGHRQYNEFHFVSNGKFSAPFKEAVDKLNDLLIERGHKTEEGLAPIALHEFVTSISDDPFNDGEIS